MSIIANAKLDFWIKNNYNVLFKGRHGVGKTATIIDAFQRHGLRWKYFSAATLDPWVDLIGVPKERKDEHTNEIYLDLVRPKDLANDEIDAIFFDEFNRCIAGDTKISLANGEAVAIKDLVGKDEFYVYAFDPKSNEIKIARGHSARKTLKNEKLLKITLDNGANFKCTIDHPILNFDGNFVRADSLVVNQSLMPLYRIWDSSTKNTNGYEMVWQPKKNSKWSLTYHMADDYNLRNNIYKSRKYDHRHHIDFTKTNNYPTNIIRLSEAEHIAIHNTNKQCQSNAGKKVHVIHPNLYSSTLGTSESKTKAICSSINTRRTDKKYKELRSKISKDMYTDAMRQHRSETTKNQWINSQFNEIDRMAALRKNHVMRTYNRLIESNIQLHTLTETAYSEVKKIVNTNGNVILTIDKIKEWFGEFNAFTKALMDIHSIKLNGNHKVIKIEEVENEDVYDITVDEYENFAIECGIFVHNSPKKVRNAVMELMQFKSINGRKFNNLKMIWAAVNPSEKTEDNEMEYDVEQLDPAQEDRFHIIMTIPYKTDSAFLQSKYGENGKVASQWWEGLPKDKKALISPRRLDYMLDIYNNQGDVRDALDNDKQINLAPLLQQLKNGSYLSQLTKIMADGDVAAGKTLMANESAYDACIKVILNDEQFALFFTTLMPKEKIVVNFRNQKYRQIVISKMDYAEFKEMFDPILNNQKSEKDKQFIKDLNTWRASSKQYATLGAQQAEQELLRELKDLNTTQTTTARDKMLALINNSVINNMSIDTHIKLTAYLVDMMYSSHRATLDNRKDEYTLAFTSLKTVFGVNGANGTIELNNIIKTMSSHKNYSDSNRMDKINGFIKSLNL